MLNEFKYGDMKAENLLHAEDWYEHYEGDSIHLYKVGTKYVLFFDSQCSCYGPFERSLDSEGDAYTKTQLLKLVNNWNDPNGAEPEMKKWIQENIT